MHKIVQKMLLKMLKILFFKLKIKYKLFLKYFIYISKEIEITEVEDLIT